MRRNARSLILIITLVILSGLVLGIQNLKIREFERGGDTLLGLSLGLDLQGGSHLVYQANVVDELTGERIEPTPEEMAYIVTGYETVEELIAKIKQAPEPRRVFISIDIAVANIGVLPGTKAITEEKYSKFLEKLENSEPELYFQYSSHKNRMENFGKIHNSLSNNQPNDGCLSVLLIIPLVLMLSLLYLL